ncbi:MAG: response regulator [Dehalococcoidia bacterium]
MQGNGPASVPAVRVMVVEDDADYQEVLILILTLEPYVKLVGVASSGEEALSQFDKADPEVVVTDYRLPDMTGLTVAERMKAQRPGLRIAMVTAFAHEIHDAVAANHAVDVLIPKSEFSLARIQGLLRVADAK